MEVHIHLLILFCLSTVTESLFSSMVLFEEDMLPEDNMDRSGNRNREDHFDLKNAANMFKADAVNGDSFYDENYVVDEAEIEQRNSEESFFNDPPAGKNYEQPFVYNRRQVPDRLTYTDEVITKQGRVKGIVRNMHPQSGLKDVDQFLGLPYAEAPVGNNRFMPPGAPPNWHGLKLAAHLPPVCPQNLPDLVKKKDELSKGRYDQLQRLLPYLKNESEDCLYLNIYVPQWNGAGPIPKYPVIIYIHGESYEWNSGNPYDGSVLASYGQVIVVTLNYRLGILGFMKPGTSDHIVSNFGLLDQIAALQWVKDNIELFGGDNQLVTLMGHGTGAACVNLLMVSPVAKGLFHRAILMSGSAMSDWATTNHSLQLTMQIADRLNCPLNDANDEMLDCLRKKRYQEILSVPTSAPKFSTSFGPIVDGLVIPNQPYKVMGQYTDLFSRYDLLFGVTEVESYHTLNALALEEGLRENERDNLLRFYMQNRFEIRPDLAVAATLKKYTDIYNNPIKASTHEHRDVILDILSDARVVAPVLQAGLFHAKVNPRSYMYVFGHNSEAGPYSSFPHSIVGEELAFVFGAPLAPVGPFHLRYSTQERLLSESVMLYWTNFAKTGNPKAPWRDHFINLHPLEWERYDIDWREFNARNQSYVNIGIPPSIGYKYRAPYMVFWNKELPDELNQIAIIQPPPYVHLYPPEQTHFPRGGTSVDHIISGHMNKFSVKTMDHTTRDPYKTIKMLLNDPLDTVDMYNAQPTFGGSTDNPRIIIGNEPEEEEMIVRSESTVQILIGVVVIFLIVNAIILSMYCIKKRKKGNKITRKLGILTYEGTTDDDLKRTKHNDGDDSYILDIIRKGNAYEPVKTPINGYQVTRQLSTSTVNTHDKVNDWISQEMVKYEPKDSKTSSPSFSIKARSLLKRPRKVSIAIDATPQARSNSVLRQEPIEITKLKSSDSTSKSIIICQEVDVDAAFLDSETTDSEIVPRRASTTSIQENSSELKINHKHSQSDPVEMYYTVHRQNEEITSFIDDKDINVTSCDYATEKDPLTPEEQLQNIKRRNFPKVLPDYPDDENDITAAMKRRSLPAHQYSFSSNQISRVPPTPPPRTISTLGRHPSSKRRQSNNITTSPLMLAEDYPEEEEPEITQNTLIIGPLVPKSSESLYCTVRGKKSHCNSIESPADDKYIKPSGIKPPSSSTFYTNRKSSNKTNIPRIHAHQDAGTRIPQLKAVPSPTIDTIIDRDKSTPESTSSDTSSSTGTVKTELKHN